MHTNDSYYSQKPPRPPPLSVSLPSPLRPGPDPDPNPVRIHIPIPIPISKPKPKPKSKSKPALTVTPARAPAPALDPKLESPHTPLRTESPTRSDEPASPPKQSSTENDTALVPHEKFYSPLTSPLPITPPKDAAAAVPLPPSQHIVNFSRREDTAAQTGIAHGVLRSKKDDLVKKGGLVVRVLEIVFCVISFSIMATDKTQGWSGDSFDRYREYRFCLSVAIFGFLYSTFQAYDSGSHLATGKHVITHRFRYQFDFLMDQILAYLLISASSAAASRVDDWQANWGKDEFTQKASASISMAFLAFVCFATSSLISGYNLCNRDLY